MYYITKEKLIAALQELPPGIEISSLGTGYNGNTKYLVVSDCKCKTLKEIMLDRRDNDAD